MSYTVKGLAKLSGVSIRMLHFYDEIELLKPSYYGENGYRYYEEEQLLMLQQILFYRELGFQLNDIRRILKSDEFNKVEALKMHKELLLQKLDHQQRLIQSIDETILYLTGEIKMEHRELYAGFDAEKQKDFEQYLIESGKVTVAELEDSRLKMKDLATHLIESGQVSKIDEDPGHVFARYLVESGKITMDEIEKQYELIKSMDLEESESIKAEAKCQQAELIDAAAKDLDPGSDFVQDILNRNYDLSCKMGKISKKKFVETVEFYLSNPELQKLYNDMHPKMSGFIEKAVKAYAKRNL